MTFGQLYAAMLRASPEFWAAQSEADLVTVEERCEKYLATANAWLRVAKITWATLVVGLIYAWLRHMEKDDHISTWGPTLAIACVLGASLAKLAQETAAHLFFKQLTIFKCRKVLSKLSLLGESPNSQRSYWIVVTDEQAKAYGARVIASNRPLRLIDLHVMEQLFARK
jgi:hypothetical protein